MERRKSGTNNAITGYEINIANRRIMLHGVSGYHLLLFLRLPPAEVLQLHRPPQEAITVDSGCGHVERQERTIILAGRYQRILSEEIQYQVHPPLQLLHLQTTVTRPLH